MKFFLLILSLISSKTYLKYTPFFKLPPPWQCIPIIFKFLVETIKGEPEEPFSVGIE